MYMIEPEPTHEQEDLRRIRRSHPPSQRLPRPRRRHQMVTNESVDLLQLAARIRAQIPTERSASDRVTRGNMTDLADRLTAMGRGGAADDALALDAEDWCRIEGWGLLRRVRQRDGGFAYETSEPFDSWPQTFTLPPFMSYADPEEEPEISAAPSAVLDEGAGVTPDVRSLADALSRLSNATGQAQTLVSGLQWPLREYQLPSQETPSPAPLPAPLAPATSPDVPIVLPDAERPVSTLHDLVCDFIDRWDEKEDPKKQPAPREFFCPLSHMAMRKPVCTGDGHLYDRAMIARAFRVSRLTNGGSVVSPMTREALASPEQTQLFPCLAIASLMERWVGERVDVADGKTLESALKAMASE